MSALFTLLPEAVGTIRADSKPAILEQLAARFAGVYGLDPAEVLERREDEALGRVAAQLAREQADQVIEAARTSAQRPLSPITRRAMKRMRIRELMKGVAR